MIGYEFEFFVVDRKTLRPIRGNVFDAVHKALAAKGWKNHYDHISNGLDYSKKGGIALKTDVVLHIFELNMPPCDTVGEADAQFNEVLGEIDAELAKAGCKALMVGGFPAKIDYCERTRGNDAIAYDIKLGETVADWYVIAGDHIWLDVEKDRMLRTMDVFNRLSGILIALFGDSPVIEEKVQPNIEQRSPLPERGVKCGFTFGVPQRPYTTFCQYLKLILGSRFYFLIDDDSTCYYLKDPKLTYLDYFEGRNRIERVDCTSVERVPKIEDVEDLLRRNFVDMRPKFRFKKGIRLQDFLDAVKRDDDAAVLGMFEKAFLEIRVVPCQRLAEKSVAPAFVLGLQENLDAIEAYLGRKDYSFWVDLKSHAIKDGLAGSDMRRIASDLAALSREGLVRRKKGEERFLEKLFRRIEKGENVGQENLGIFKKEGVRKLVEANLAFP
jgi:gamma-glutamylcysteine synthetase